MEQLTIRNAHRAKTVRIKGNETVVELRLEPKYGSVDYFAGETQVHPNQFDKLEVVEFKYPITLDEYWGKAISAFSWTSFDSERRGQRAISEHELWLNKDLESIPESEQEAYIAGFKKLFGEWLSSESNCVSSAVTGGSRFNAERANKAWDRAMKKAEALNEWSKKTLNRIQRNERERLESLKTDEQKAEEEWETLKSSIEKSCVKANIYSRVERIAHKGNVALTERAIEHIRTLGIFTPRHKVFTLPEVAKRISEKMHPSEEIYGDTAFIGGKIVLNHGEDRVQLIFDGKPSPDIIAKLKSAAFRWSPRFGAWQRQLTVNGVNAAKLFLKSNGLIIK